VRQFTAPHFRLSELGSLKAYIVTTRRTVLQVGAIGASARILAADDAPFTLPKLPYAYDALEPYIDAQTMQIHHDRHHKAYVDNLNKAIGGDPALCEDER